MRVEEPSAETLPKAAMPEPWFGSAEEGTFAKRLQAASRRVLLLDYDGTLAPFNANKMEAWPYPGVNAVLHELRASYDVRIVLVTGREASDLRQLIELAKDVEVWGSHGREHITEDGRYTLLAPTSEQYAALDVLQSEMDRAVLDLPICGTKDRAAPKLIERKPGSVAVHWRGLDAAAGEQMQRMAETACRGTEAAGIERLPFASGVEFRAAGYTKAIAVESVLEGAGAEDVIAYLGDDLTDEDAFRALRGRGTAMLVREERRVSEAQFSLRPPEDLLRFLESWKVRQL